MIQTFHFIQLPDIFEILKNKIKPAGASAQAGNMITRLTGWFINFTD